MPARHEDHEHESPQFLNDLYRDLRDRHLLLPAAVLAIALVAVPMLLKSTTTPAAAPGAERREPDRRHGPRGARGRPDVSVRDYRQRLDDLKSKNPFRSSSRTPEEEDPTDGTPDADLGSHSAAHGPRADPAPSTAPSGSPLRPAGPASGPDDPAAITPPTLPDDVDVVTHLFSIGSTSRSGSRAICKQAATGSAR